MNTEQIERKIVSHMVNTLEAKGWMLEKVYDGELHFGAEADLIEAVFDTDEATLTFRRGNTRHSVFIVRPNGADCIADNSYCETDDFGTIMDEEVAPYAEGFER